MGYVLVEIVQKCLDIEEGAAFLAENAEACHVCTMASIFQQSVQYEI